MRIPRVLHACFGMAPDFGGRITFGFIHYLSIKTAWLVHQPEVIRLYYAYEPSGEWWQKAKGYVQCERVAPPQKIFGNPLIHYAHQSDVLRLEKLIEHGGIYIDLDVININSFEPLMCNSFVLGRQGTRGLCNAVMLAEAGSKFLQRWYQEYRTFRSTGRDQYWDEHSVLVPLQLADKYPDEVTILPADRFFFPLWNRPEVLWDFPTFDRPSTGSIPSLLVSRGRHFMRRARYQLYLKELFFRLVSKSYCTHLWENIWWETYLEQLTPKQILSSNSNFSRLFRKYVEDEL